MTCTIITDDKKLFEYNKPARNGQTSLVLSESDWNTYTNDHAGA
jgi:hypothetical protein